MDTQTNWTELLEREYGNDPVAQRIIQGQREKRHSDEEIYNLLESFY